MTLPANPRSVSMSDLAALTPEEARQLDQGDAMSDPVTVPARVEGAPLAPVARNPAAPVPMADVIMEAVRQKLPAAELERLFALAERAADRQAKQDFNAALAAFQAACPQIHKAKTVDFASKSGARVHYTYAPLEVIAKAIAPALRLHGLSYTFTTTLVDNARMDVTCHVRHAGGHTESATFPCPIMEGTGSMSDPQKGGGTVTFGMRNALRMALGLTSTDDDTDARAPEDDALITDEQRSQVESAMAELRGDPAAFCKLLGVERIDQIPASKWSRACDLIARKRASVQKGGGA